MYENNVNANRFSRFFIVSFHATVAAQFCPFHDIRQAMIHYRDKNQPAVPKNLSEIVPTLQADLWKDRLSYKVTLADKYSKTTKITHHQLESMQVEDEDGGLHVIFATKSYAQFFQDVPNIFLDATFDVVPNIDGGYQLLTMMGGKRGQVRYHHRDNKHNIFII